jgi:hypothetical protein
MTDPQVNAVNSLFFLFLSTVWCDGLGPNISDDENESKRATRPKVKQTKGGDQNCVSRTEDTGYM